MTAITLMNPDPMTLRPADTVATAAAYILEHHLRHLPVVNEQGRYLGTFSIYSLLKLTLPKAVLDKHGLDNVSFVTEHVGDLAQRLGGRREEPVQNWLNQHDVAHPDTPAMEVMLVGWRASFPSGMCWKNCWGRTPKCTVPKRNWSPQPSSA